MVMLICSAASPSRALALKLVNGVRSSGQQQQRAAIHDLIIKRKTGQPIIKSGPYGGGR